MKQFIFIIIFVAFGCSTLEANTHIQIKYPTAEYDSKTKIFTRKYCREHDNKKSTKLELSQKEIIELIDAAKETIRDEETIDPETGEKVSRICITGGRFAPTVTVFTDKGKEDIGLFSCEEESKFNDAIKKIIFDSKSVKELEDSNCRFY